MPEFVKIEPGQDGYLGQFPHACIICNSAKGPIVETFADRSGAGADVLHVYLCRLCTTRAARQLGLVKGDEMNRLQSAADELAQAAVEIAERQENIDRLTRSLGEAEGKNVTLQAYIETLQADIQTHKASWNQVFGVSKERVTA